MKKPSSLFGSGCPRIALPSSHRLQVLDDFPPSLRVAVQHPAVVGVEHAFSTPE
jgi:hypothetical protein